MVRKYFAGANTSSGYISLMENNFQGVEKVYGIYGKSKKYKTEIMESFLEKAGEKYQNIECLINPFDITIIDGVIIRDIKTAVVDMNEYVFKNPIKTIDIGSFENKATEEIDILTQKQGEAKERFYKAYAEGKIIHDDWEQIYIKNMKFDRLISYQDGVIRQLFQEKNDISGTQKYHRFFGASTPDGSVNYIDNLTRNMKKRYYIKGRPGTGKSTFLKRVVKRADEMGYDTEIYYCSFDKDSLDMVIVPELQFCVFDSTAPHEMFPESDRDEILDFYQESGLLGIDEKYEKELSVIGERYKHKMAEGMAYLRLYKLYMKEIERLTVLNTDEMKFGTFRTKIAADILGT